MNVLIVEDNPSHRKLLRYTFEHHGCTVIEAMDGKEGLELASAHLPDIIVSDALMPVMDGFQLLRALKTDPATSGIPFVFYSATYSGRQETSLALTLGAEAFLAKPKEPEELWEETSRIFRVREAERKVAVPAAGENEEQFLREYSQIVAAKLEEKVGELENALAASEQAESEVRRLNSELEQRVRDRTAALEQKSGELEESRLALVSLVEDLNQKAEELERANQALSQEIVQRQHAQEEITLLNEDLQRQKQALEATNKELETFSYSVSHDLQAPIRHISGFIKILIDECGGKLDETALRYLERISHASLKMQELISALLKLSRLSRSEMSVTSLNVSALVREIAASLQQGEPERRVDFTIADGVTIKADEVLMRVVLENLLGNAWKYTRRNEETRIEFGSFTEGGRTVCFVKDNGAGFDMTRADRLFGAFQRLHTEEEFQGSGIGLATVQRIIHRHGGRVWAEGKVDAGATFYFTVG